MYRINMVDIRDVRSRNFALQHPGSSLNLSKLGPKATDWYEPPAGRPPTNRATGRRTAPGGPMAPGPYTYRPVGH